MSQTKDGMPCSGNQNVIEIVTVGGQTNCLDIIPLPSAQLSASQIQAFPTTIPNAALSAEPQPTELPQITPQPHANNNKYDEKGEAQLEEVAEVEDYENIDEESNQQSNVVGVLSKSQKTEKKVKSNCESLDQRKGELPSSRKCFNKLCSSKKIYKKIRSKVQDNKYRFFCKNCYENYYNTLYCEFCEQIYSNSYENEDDDKWIGCDNCQRWNHIECEKKFRNKTINQLKDKNALYQCLVCSQKTKNSSEKSKKQDKQQVEDKVAPKQKIELNRDQKMPIFNKKIESFQNLESLLQNFSFRLWLSQSQIRQDLQYLRATCLKTNQQDGGKSRLKKGKND